MQFCNAVSKVFSWKNKKTLRQPGIEPGSSAWEAPMLTITPLTLAMWSYFCHLISTVAWKLNVARKVRQPGIEHGSIAWKATMLTFTPPTLCVGLNFRRSDERRVKHYKPGSNPWWRTVLFVKDYKTCGAHNFSDIQYLYILRGVLSRNCVLRDLAKKSTLRGIEPGQGYW